MRACVVGGAWLGRWVGGEGEGRSSPALLQLWLAPAQPTLRAPFPFLQAKASAAAAQVAAPADQNAPSNLLANADDADIIF